MNNQLNSELSVSCTIWDKEVYELIDYYNTNMTKTKLTINSSGVLSRQEKEITFTPGEKLDKTEYDLLTIKKNEETGRYSVDCGTWSKDLNKLIDEDGAYIVYRGLSLKEEDNSYSSRYYKLSQGDIFKIGRIYFKVLDIHASKNKFNKLGLNFNGDESTLKGSGKGDNYDSIVINGQEIIRGAFKKKDDKKKNIKDLYNSGRAKPVINSFFKIENSKNDDNQYKFSEITVKLNGKQNPDIELFSLTRRPKKMKEKIKEKKINKNKHSSKVQDNNEKTTENCPLPKKTKLCRICYGEDSTIDNPLIYPCICKGSMKYIHYECLKNWLNSKIEEDISVDDENNEIEVISYNRKDISCELCKEKLPDYIKYNNRFYNISFYKPKFNEFIVLESMRADKHRAKFIHIISFDTKDSINLGRANECELSIAELSVSRYHCIIHKDDGDVFIEDNSSKFGTLILVQNNNLIISDSLPLNLQINKTFIKIKVPTISGCSFLCCKEQPAVEQLKFNYQIQNRKGLDILSYFIIKENDDNQDDDEEEENDNNNLENKEINNEKDNKNKEKDNESASVNIENDNDNNDKKKNDLIDDDNDNDKNEDYNKEQNDIKIDDDNDNDDEVKIEDSFNDNNDNKSNLIDKDDNEENINKNNIINNKKNKNDIDNKSFISENKLANSTRIKRISIKKDDNDLLKNNLSCVVDKQNNNSKINENGNGSKIINLIKIKNPTINYDKTNSNPATTNFQNIYAPSKTNNLENNNNE